MKTNHHETIFATAWNNQHHTSIKFPPLDLNHALANRYVGVEDIALSRTRIWDMELKKAARPDLFIPSVVRAGTARSWDHRHLENGDETFFRVSDQRLWLQPNRYGTIIEGCYLNHSHQEVTFIGLPEARDDSGQLITATSMQPLFHVVHGVTGPEEMPFNTWRIAHLANDEDAELSKRFERMSQTPGLPEYVERYLEDVLKHPLTPQRIRTTSEYQTANIK